jgi:phospholipase/carboxylesterase
MIHGWTGDENSMWVFAHKLPAHVAVLAPRGPYVAPEGGYTWREIQPGIWGLPGLDDLRPSAEALIGFVDDWSHAAGVSANQMELIGFSQGAALSYTLALLHPERIQALAALSGFMPRGAEDLFGRRPLVGKSVFIAHGRQDYMIPVE